MQQPTSERITEIFDNAAAGYDRQIGFFERLALGNARAWAVRHARGKVVEIAIGTGLNLPHYSNQVDELLGIDLSQQVLDLAAERARELDIDVELRRGDVQHLDLPDASVDTVISTYSFCTIPDPALASAQAYRVLRPGGIFVLAEHGPATVAPLRLLMRLLDPISVRFGADHLMRDPRPYLTDAGFTITESRRSGRGGVTFRILAHKPPAR